VVSRSCGAIRAAAAALQDGTAPTGFVRAIVDRVIPSAVTPAGDDHTAPALTLRPEELGREHVHHTVRVLQEDSPVLHAAVEDGRCAIVGAEYSLRAGTVQVISTVGPVGSAGA
jgi:carbonic anhydrase